MLSETFGPFEKRASVLPVISVSTLNRRVASLLQNEIPALWVKGEIRGFTHATSGHWYFTLKDEGSEIRCAMFAGANRRIGFYPRTGDKVEVFGRVSLYQPRGDYQLVVDAMRQAGLGRLYEQFLRLKEKLEREGLFAVERKLAIPSLNRRIGVVTSLQAAALRDVITTLARRAPYAKVIIYPAAVQGDDASGELIQALETVDSRQEVDVVLLVRGGGSLQDLWAFNDEGLARTIASMRIPVIVGVGHESDFTIADWVADKRAPTPTAAAEMATVGIDVLCDRLQLLDKTLKERYDRIFQEKAQRLDWARSQLRTPSDVLKREHQRIRERERSLSDLISITFERARQRQLWLSQRLTEVRPDLSGQKHRLLQVALETFCRQRLQLEKARLEQLTVVLEDISPSVVLKRGYAMVTDDSGHVVSSTSFLQKGQGLNILMLDGEVMTEVKDIRPAH